MTGRAKVKRAIASAVVLAMGFVSGSSLALTDKGTREQPSPNQGTEAPAPSDTGQSPSGTGQTPRNTGQNPKSTGQSPKSTEPRPQPGGSENAPGSGRAAAAPKPVETEATAVIATATIQKLDKADRKLTLQGPSGQSFDVKAGPDVDFDRLHVGDRVNATYYEEVAVAINRIPHAAPSAAARTVQRGGVTAKQATVTARIVAVDAADDTVTVRTADGRQRTVKVEDPALQAELPAIRPGDDVDLTYTQAVAIEIEPAGEPSR
jgi:hypothetical protein